MKFRPLASLSFAALAVAAIIVILAILTEATQGATVIVKNFPNPQAAINASATNGAAGDTIDFTGVNGAYSLAAIGNRIYIGGGATLTEANGQFVFGFLDNSHDVQISGFHFVGRAIYAAGNQRPQRFEIIGNTFGGTPIGGTNPAGIFLVNPLNYLIAHNASTLSSQGGGFGVIWGGRGAVVDNSIQCPNGGEGVHYNGQAANHEQFIFAGNYGACGQKLCEAQNAGDDIEILNNRVDDGYAYAAAGNMLNGYFGLSIATDLATKIKIIGNVINAPTRTDGIGMRIGIELGANPGTPGAAEIAGNSINGINAGITVNTSNAAYVHDNQLTNCLQPTQTASAAINPRMVNNGPNVSVPAQTWPLPQYTVTRLSDVINGTVGVLPTPPVVTPPAPPTLTHTISVYSDGSILTKP